MKLIATRKSEQNQSVIDPWTAVHAGMGLACGLVNMSALTSLSAALSYELIEQVAERSDAAQNFFDISGPEIPANSAMDVLVFAFGWWIGRKWNRS